MRPSIFQFAEKTLKGVYVAGLRNEDPNTSTITLTSAVSRPRMEAKFIHEIMHVMNYSMKHDFLDSLAEEFYQVLSDNKMLR